MYFKKSPFATKDKNQKDLDNANDYPTIADLMKKQRGSNDVVNSVHHRRDLDSLGQPVNLNKFLNLIKSPFLLINYENRKMYYV